MTTRAKRQFQDLFTDIFTGNVVASVAAVAAGGRQTQNVTVPGVLVSDVGLFVQASADPGSVIMYCKVTANDTVTIVFENNTAGSVTPPASTTYSVVVGRPSGFIATA